MLLGSVCIIAFNWIYISVTAHAILTDNHNSSMCMSPDHQSVPGCNSRVSPYVYSDVDKRLKNGDAMNFHPCGSAEDVQPDQARACDEELLIDQEPRQGFEITSEQHISLLVEDNRAEDRFSHIPIRCTESWNGADFPAHGRRRHADAALKRRGLSPGASPKEPLHLSEHSDTISASVSVIPELYSTLSLPARSVDASRSPPSIIHAASLGSPASDVFNLMLEDGAATTIIVTTYTTLMFNGASAATTSSSSHSTATSQSSTSTSLSKTATSTSHIGSLLSATARPSSSVSTTLASTTYSMSTTYSSDTSSFDLAITSSPITTSLSSSLSSTISVGVTNSSQTTISYSSTRSVTNPVLVTTVSNTSNQSYTSSTAPSVVTKTPQSAAHSGSDSSRTGLIVAVVIASSVVFILLALLAVWRCRRRGVQSAQVHSYVYNGPSEGTYTDPSVRRTWSTKNGSPRLDRHHLSSRASLLFHPNDGHGPPHATSWMMQSASFPTHDSATTSNMLASVWPTIPAMSDLDGVSYYRGTPPEAPDGLRASGLLPPIATRPLTVGFLSPDPNSRRQSLDGGVRIAGGPPGYSGSVSSLPPAYGLY